MLRVISSKFIKSAVHPKDYPTSQVAEIAFVGKSNVGKSSMINTVLNRKVLAKISGKPGKTRLLNFFDIRLRGEKDYSIIFTDLPGYGYAKISMAERENWKKMVETYFQKRKNLKAVVILVDIRHPQDEKDSLMVKMLENLGIRHIIVATKSDKIGTSIVKKTIEKNFDFEDIIPFSSLKKKGINEFLYLLESII